MDLTSKQISKYQKYSIPELRKKAGIKFRKFIRERDNGCQCCSCDSWNIAHASHLYSAGKHPELEFNEDNCWSSCVQCNTHLHGNLLNYRKKLVYKIGIERVEKLESIVERYRQIVYKHDRYFLISIIEKYR